TRRRFLLRDLLEELIEDELAIDSELLEAMIERDVCALKELPKELRSQVKRHRFIDIFIEREAEYLKAFRSIPPGKEGKQLANVARHVFPELLHRGKYTDAAAVLVAVTVGGKSEGVGEAVAKLLKSLRQSARDEEAVKRLIDALGDEDLNRLDRDAVVALLSVAGKKAASGLRELYAKTQDQTVRGSAFDAMMGIGLPALEPFLAELANSEEEWPVVHHILGALGDQTDPALAKPIERFLAHENDHVRQVALTRVFELLGAESEELLIRTLGEPGAVTRHAAVAYLGQLQSRNPNVLDFYVAALGVEVPKNESGQPEEVLVEVCRSLAGLGEATLGHGIGLEEFLLDALTQGGKKGLLGKLKKRSARHSEKVRIAICEALGTAGTEVGAEVLTELATGDSPELAEAATSALEAIRSR
ncbi:MAG: HEAT repeat domain-containing protein, partial [Gemmatimonadetes bacterium]|nr:HEAT repeat domain-containing protein [Gemmatimonadota bacterium]